MYDLPTVYTLYIIRINNLNTIEDCSHTLHMFLNLIMVSEHNLSNKESINIQKCEA
jgi:hypothetical protein